jgi:predicted nucleic acid-binding protein
MGERRGRLPVGMPGQALGVVEALGIELGTAPSSAAALRLSRTHGRSVDDAMYLALALRLRAPLTTLDGGLVRAARAKGVAVV